MSNDTKKIKTQVLTAKDLGLSTDRKKVTERSFGVAVRAILQNWRQGTVTVKGRSDVSFSNKKPWRQKGTGRARAGSARSPVWRGGGVCHGPMPRTRRLSVNKQMRSGVFGALLWDRVHAGNLVALSSVGGAPKTAAAYALLNDAGLIGKKIAVFVPAHDYVSRASFGNIDRVRVLAMDAPNVFDLSHAQHWVVFDKDINSFKEMVRAWQI